MSNKIITLRELKIKQEHVNSDLDNKGCVELKEIFFDLIIWTTPKAVLLQKGNKTAWVARSVIAEVTESTENEPNSMFVFSWVNINFLDKKEGKK